MRVSLVASLLLVTGCSGPTVPAPTPRATPAPAPVTVQGLDEVSLRRALADDADPLPAACELANRLLEHDRHAEALAVLDAGLARRADSPTLRILHARVLYDLARFAEARDELASLVAKEASALALHDLAECERALGHAAPAMAALDRLAANHAQEPWAKARGELLDRLAQEVRAELAAGRRLYRSARESLALVRGGSAPTARVQALANLALEGGEYATRALEIALADEEPAVRAHALGIYRQACPELATVVAFGLADPAPLVRGTAARLVTGPVAPTLVAELLRVLSAESDAHVSEQLGKALERATGRACTLAALDLKVADDRARLATWWRTVVGS